MKRLAKLLVYVTFATLPLSASAVWEENLTVKSIETNNNGELTLTAVEVVPGCDVFKAWVGKNSLTVEGQKHVLATLLTAAALGKTVDVLHNAGVQNCWIRNVRAHFASP